MICFKKKKRWFVNVQIFPVKTEQVSYVDYKETHLISSNSYDDSRKDVGYFFHYLMENK